MVHPSKRKERTAETWESWVDETIRDAKDRGEFDNLPGAGKPLNLNRNPLAGDRELAFHMLNNADVLPPWMELDRDLARARAEIDASLQQVVARIERLRRHACENHPDLETEPEPRGRAMLRLLRGGAPDRSVRTVDPADVEWERQQARSKYLDRAASLDRQIREFNAALPDEIRHLERVRVTPETAARAFDTACPQVTCP